MEHRAIVQAEDRATLKRVAKEKLLEELRDFIPECRPDFREEAQLMYDRASDPDFHPPYTSEELILLIRKLKGHTKNFSRRNLLSESEKAAEDKRGMDLLWPPA